MASIATVFVQNIAALCNVTEAIPEILHSARTLSNVDNTFFLLRPYNSDHLGTIHHIPFTSPHKTLIIIMPEVLITSDDDLMKLPNIVWSHDGTNGTEYCPVRVEYGWGSGKYEVNTFLQQHKQNQEHDHEQEQEQKQKQKEENDSNTTTPSSTIIIPATKGLCCIMYEEISSTTHGKGTFRLPPILAEPSRRTIPWKKNNDVLCEHLYTKHFIVTVADLSNGQTHVGAVRFNVSDHLMIVGCHLTFQGGQHPDVKGAVIRKAQVEAILQDVKENVSSFKGVQTGCTQSGSQSSQSYQCCIAGDINVRPTVPAGQDVAECRAMVDPVLSLTNQPEAAISGLSPTTTNELALGRTTSTTTVTTTTQIATTPSWSSTDEWRKTPYHENRIDPIRNPPTYPIRNHELWEILLSRKNQLVNNGPTVGTIFESPSTLKQEHCYFHSCGGWKEGNQKKSQLYYEKYERMVPLGTYAETYDFSSMYDTYKKNRFTPSSWTDGLLLFEFDL